MLSLLRCSAPRRQLILASHTFSRARLFSMSSTAYSASQADEELAASTSNPDAPNEPLALPEVPHNGTTQLDLSNGDATVKLDHLGPMVIGVDGTLSRISNWEGMTAGEKKATLRIIGRRNQQRLDALKAKEGGE